MTIAPASWTSLYPDGVPASLPAPTRTIVDAFAATLSRDPAAPSLHVFDETLTFGDVHRSSEAIASLLAARGVTPGDRVALYLQNDPQFVIAQLAVWKLGAVAVSVNPMLKADELEYVLTDSGAKVLVTLDELHDQVAAPVLARTEVELVLRTGAADGVAVGRDAVGGGAGRVPDDAIVDMLEWVTAWDGTAPARGTRGLDDVACLGYTSGTSGLPKGVITTHSNLAYNAEVYRRWMDIGPDDAFVCGAPLFHVTGLVAAVGLSHLTGMPIILFHRFDAGELLRLSERWGGTMTVMAITAFRALLQHPDIASRDLSRLTKVYSGGSPVSRAATDEWEAATGSPIHNIYGLTETTSPSHAVPLGREAPVDDASGAMAVGIPVPGARSRVIDPATMQDVPPGELGEILVAGPMVTPGYWNKPEVTEESFHEGHLRTGDIGMVDADGWYYVVDRLKDIINAAGYKVSPREVEDGLRTHPAVLEAAVIGVADGYRGETVAAFVTLREGASASPEELVEHCRQRMAAYKYPRTVEVVEELPTTSSGKILRRELRARVAP